MMNLATVDFNLDHSIAILERTPLILRTYLWDLSGEWTLPNEGENTWSPFDVVGHLIHGEITDWIPRSKIILNQGENRKFEPFDRFAQFKNSKGKSLNDLLEKFQLLRTENIRELKSFNLNESKLSLQGVHPELGPVTLSQLLAAWTVHDLGHIAQISRVMAKQYKSEVGPWPRYLSILT